MLFYVDSSWNVMAHGDSREGKWRGSWRMEWVTSTLHTTSQHGVSSITTADAHTSAASSRLNWRPRRLKWTLPFPRKTKYGFCACAITFQTQSTTSFNRHKIQCSANNVFICFVFIWEQTATCATYSINWLVFITEMKSVYSAVRTGSLNKAVCASSLQG